MLSRNADVLLNGTHGATTPDDRTIEDVASLVHDELASGADLDEACATAGVTTRAYLAATLDNASLHALHDRAQRMRAMLLADATLRLARELRAARSLDAVRPMGVTLGEVVRTIHEEASLLSQLAGWGDAISYGKQTAHQVTQDTTIRVIFDALPDASAQIQSADYEVLPAELSDDAPASCSDDDDSERSADSATVSPT